MSVLSKRDILEALTAAGVTNLDELAEAIAVGRGSDTPEGTPIIGPDGTRDGGSLIVIWKWDRSFDDLSEVNILQDARASEVIQSSKL